MAQLVCQTCLFLSPGIVKCWPADTVPNTIGPNISLAAPFDRPMFIGSSSQKGAALGWPSQSSGGLQIGETVVVQAEGQRDREPFHFKPEPSREPH